MMSYFLGLYEFDPSLSNCFAGELLHLSKYEIVGLLDRCSVFDHNRLICMAFKDALINFLIFWLLVKVDVVLVDDIIFFFQLVICPLSKGPL